MALLNCKCPSCGGDLKINENAKGMLRCPFCGSEYLAEEAITQVTNNINVTTVNNYSGATIIGGKEDFVMERGVLLKYNGNDTTIVIPEGVREFGEECEFGDYAEKIILPMSLSKLNLKNAKNYFEALDGSKNPNFKKEDDIIYFDNEPIIYGPTIKKFELKDNQQLTDALFAFILSNTFIEDIYLPKTENTISYEIFSKISNNEIKGINLIISNMYKTYYINSYEVRTLTKDLIVQSTPEHIIFSDETLYEYNSEQIAFYNGMASSYFWPYLGFLILFIILVCVSIAAVVLFFLSINGIIKTFFITLSLFICVPATIFAVLVGMDMKSNAKDYKRYKELVKSFLQLNYEIKQSKADEVNTNN